LGTETFNANGTVANSAPTAQSDNNPAYTVNEDGTLNISALEDRVLFNDTDPDGDNLTAVNASNPAGGTVTLNPNGSFNYAPEPDFNGADAFTYQANDGLANSNTATVSITVTPVNDLPGFQAGPDQVVSASDGAVSVAGWATGIVPGPTNESSQTVSFQVSTDNDAAFAALPAVDPSGTLNYTPQATLSQIDVSVTVGALDSGGATSDPQVFTITIDP
jgi:VCBS repeat-containing protein